jgi:hypothetical protein
MATGFPTSGVRQPLFAHQPLFRRWKTNGCIFVDGAMVISAFSWPAPASQ